MTDHPAGLVTIHTRTGEDDDTDDGDEAKTEQEQPRVARSGPIRMHVLVPNKETGEVPECDCGTFVMQDEPALLMSDAWCVAVAL